MRYMFIIACTICCVHDTSSFLFSSPANKVSVRPLTTTTRIKISNDNENPKPIIQKTSSEKNGLDFNFHNDRNMANHQHMSETESMIRKVTMMSYIASMCIALPLTLFPLYILSKTEWVEKREREHWALIVGEFCARWLLFLMPFMDMKLCNDNLDKEKSPKPCIWVCNHTSMLDTFVLLAADLKLRGPNKRPIKAIYWKGLEKNPVTNLMFQLCGFIPVQMEANGAGVPNAYDKASFKTLLRNAKKAFEEGFDLLVLPEGQLNPRPESGLLEVFPGAYHLSHTSKRPMRMVALHGLHRLWHADESIGMTVTGKDVKVRGYPKYLQFESGEQFVETFTKVVGHFGTYGEDLPSDELQKWLDGSAWEEEKNAEKQISTDTLLPPPSSRPTTEDVESEILALLERKGRINVDQFSMAEEEGDRTPVGVHMCKPPLLIHEFVPTSGHVEDRFSNHQQKQTVPRIEFSTGDTTSYKDIEDAIRSTMERERHNIISAEEFSSDSSKPHVPVGVHMCKSSLTKYLLDPPPDPEQ